MMRERPDIYADGLREERCENCLHCCATVLRGVRREARALCKRLDPKWRRARIRALKRSRRNVETLKREGRCR